MIHRLDLLHVYLTHRGSAPIADQVSQQRLLPNPALF